MMKTDRDFPPIRVDPSIDQILNSTNTILHASFSTNKKKIVHRFEIKILLHLLILQGYRSFSKEQKATDLKSRRRNFSQRRI